MWRYREFLPVRKVENIVSLGESITPLLGCRNLETRYGIERIFVKDESRMPTGSFKARGLALAISMARELGVTKVAIPTNGNAGAAAAAYASRAGMDCYVFCPDITTQINVREAQAQGARTFTVNGLISQCAKIVLEGKEKMSWFDLSTLKEPYRIEGKKTMGLELAEQFDWEPPDVIFYPTGGGTGLIGMWKMFFELQAMGWINKIPRLVAVQATGCAPIVHAFKNGLDHCETWDNPHTLAGGMRVPSAIGDFLMLRSIRETEGFAIAVDDDAILSAEDEMSRAEGLLMCPEGAATWAACKKALAGGKISKQDSVVLFNTCAGVKYPLPAVDQHIDTNTPFDYSRLQDK